MRVIKMITNEREWFDLLSNSLNYSLKKCRGISLENLYVDIVGLNC